MPNEQTYVCPMHPEVRQPSSGKCSQCGMDLLPEGTRFAMLRHIVGNPVHLVVMAAVMLALMALAMVMMR
jgi:Heavy metal binding domain